MKAHEKGLPSLYDDRIAEAKQEMFICAMGMANCLRWYSDHTDIPEHIRAGMKSSLESYELTRKQLNDAIDAKYEAAVEASRR